MKELSVLLKQFKASHLLRWNLRYLRMLRLGRNVQLMQVTWNWVTLFRTVALLRERGYRDTCLLPSTASKEKGGDGNGLEEPHFQLQELITHWGEGWAANSTLQKDKRHQFMEHEESRRGTVNPNLTLFSALLLGHLPVTSLDLVTLHTFRTACLNTFRTWKSSLWWHCFKRNTKNSLIIMKSILWLVS